MTATRIVAFISFASTGEFLQDVLCQKFVYFPVPGYWLRNICFRVTVPIVITTVPNEHASSFVQFADQIGPLHPRVSSATLRIPEISPLTKSL